MIKKQLLFITFILISLRIVAQADHFVTTWKTTTANESITIPINSSPSYNYNYTVDWGDGTVMNYTSSATHTYVKAGKRTVHLWGDFPAIYFNNTGDKDKLIDVIQWGTQKWQTMRSAFAGCSNLLGFSATDIPDLSNVEDTSFMFSNAIKFNQDLSGWDVSGIGFMNSMFENAISFNQDLSSWDVSDVLDMTKMFKGVTLTTKNYDKLLQGWSTQNLESGVTFSGGNSQYCAAETERQNIRNNFNWIITDGGKYCSPDLSTHFVTTWQTTTANESITIPTNPDTTNLTYNYTVDWGDGEVISGYTGNATHSYVDSKEYTIRIWGDFPAIYFNNTGDKDKIKDVKQWGGQVWQTMNSAFYGCSKLQITASDTPNLTLVINMANMFRNATSLNQPLNWDTKNIQTMSSMFANASRFNQPLNWDTGNVKYMNYMFAGARVFNQPLNWDTRQVKDMSHMFYVAKKFDQDISNWSIENVSDMTSMFELAKLSTQNYDKLLKGWSVQTIQSGIEFNGGDSKYCSASTEREALINKGWKITDAGKDLSCIPPDPKTHFVTIWKTSTANESITIPIITRNISYNYNYSIDWGDGTIESGLTGNSNATHTFTNLGEHTIRIWGDFPAIYFDSIGDKEKIIEVIQWGTQKWLTMSGAFDGCSNLKVKAIDIPDLSKVKRMNNMFYGVASITGVSDWDTSNVEHMDYLFTNVTTFNEPLNWDTKNVKNMSHMFQGATSFNQPLNWNTTQVSNMGYMFNDATSFNQPLNWNTTQVTNMDWMFTNASTFNQDISNWNVSNVTSMMNMLGLVTLSTENYDKLLKSWSLQALKRGVMFSAGNNQYCTAETERQSMITNFAWNITDGGKDCSTLSTEENSLVKIKLYPNPTQLMFQLNTLPDKVIIYSIAGEIVKEFKDIPSINYKYNIDDLSPSMYLVLIKSNLIKTNFKLIKN